MDKPGSGVDFLRVLVLISQLGLTIAMPILGGLLLGRYLSEAYGTGNGLTVTLMLLGVMAGFQGAYRLIMRTLRSTETGNKE